MKQMFKAAKIPVPLLSPARHGLCDQSLDSDGHKICGAYKEQVTCASCHSNELPPTLWGKDEVYEAVNSLNYL